MSEYLLGVDGGGTGTTCLLAGRDGTVLGRGSAGPSNYLSVGAERALAAINDAVDQAFQSAGIGRGPVAVACLGLAGAGRPADEQRLRELLTPLQLAGELVITHDAAIALAAGLYDPEGPGIVIIAGTGSIAFGRNRAGETARAGGWGWLLGDEGSGYTIGRNALIAVLAAHDGRKPPTGLLAAIMDAWKLQNPEEIVGRVYNNPDQRRQIAALAGIVMEQARQGDAAAQAIMGEAARELAMLAIAVAARLNMDETAATAIVLSGGIFRAAGDLIVAPLRSAIAAHLPGAQIIDRHAEPVEGAIRIAQAHLSRQ